MKKSADGSTTLEGTKYRIWNDKGYNKEFITDKAGKIVVEGLALGKYYYKEIQASYGYLLNDTTYSFELTYKNQDTEVVYANAEKTNEKPTGTFTLVKKNAEKTETLKGTKYKIWNDNGYNKECETDENGKFTVEGLELGTYYYKEIQAPYGYLLDDTTYSFELVYKDQNTKVVYVNVERTNEKPTGTFTLLKTNADGSATLEGTKYRIWNNNGYDKEFITDKNGKIVVEELKLGTYYYKEVEASNGYLLDDTTYSFELNYKDQNTSVIYSETTKTNKEPTGTIEIIKRDCETGQVAQGNATLLNAKYEIYAEDDIYNKAKTIKYYSKGDLVDTRIMNVDGTTDIVKNLPLGKYIVKEVVSSEGYLLDKTEHKISLEYANQNVEIVSERVTSLEVVKKMQVHIFKSGIKEHSGEVPGLQGAEFTIKLYSDVQETLNAGYSYEEIWNGVNEYGNSVKVDSNRIKEAQDIAPSYEVIVTDANGDAYTENKLPYGKYIVKETKTPKDFESASDFTFSITQDESEIQEIAQKVKDIVVNNEQLETYIKLIKKDKDTGKIVTLNSATFEIKATQDIYDRGNGKLIYKKGENIIQKIGSTIYSSFTTNADNIVVPDNSYNTENDNKGTVVTPLMLEVGSYEIIEINTPIGYLQLEQPIQFKVEGIRDYDKDQEGDYIKEIIIENEKPTGTLIVDKNIVLRENVDTSLIVASDLSEIQFRLTAKEDIIDYADGSIVYEKGTEIGIYNLDKNGNLKVENLLMGTYELQEIQTLNGLVLSDTKYEVKFTPQDTIIKVYEETKEIENYTTLVEFSKQDITGEKELEGAVLVVIDEKGEIIDLWTSTNKPHTIEGLKVDKEYTLREDLAPIGYAKATDIKFKVKNTNELQKVVMIDKIVEISKIDFTTGKELPGAELMVTDTNGNIIDKWISTEKPHQISGLEEGQEYILTEITSPYGYEIAESIIFKVTTEKDTQTVEMVDKPIVKSIKIIKLDKETNEIIKANFEFGIYEDAEGTKLIKEVKADKATGTVIFEELRYGTYYIKETKAPKGYQLSNEVIKIEISDKGVFAKDEKVEEQEKVYSITYYNEPIPKIQTGNETNYAILIGSIILSLAGITRGIVVLRRKNK